MNRRQFISGLLKTAAAVAVLGPVVLNPETKVPRATQENIVSAYSKSIQENIVTALQEAIRDELNNSNYYKALAVCTVT